MFSCLRKHKHKHQENNICKSSYEQEFKMLCWPLLMLGSVLTVRCVVTLHALAIVLHMIPGQMACTAQHSPIEDY